MDKDTCGTLGRFSDAARLEEQLSAALAEAASEVSRAEIFDVEQRSEVYAILDAISADTQAHRCVVGRWANDQTGSVQHV